MSWLSPSRPLSWLGEDWLLIRGFTQLVNHPNNVGDTRLKHSLGTGIHTKQSQEMLVCSLQIKNSVFREQDVLMVKVMWRNPLGKSLCCNRNLLLVCFHVRQCCDSNCVLTFTCCVVRWHCLALQSNCLTITLRKQINEELFHAEVISWQV